MARSAACAPDSMLDELLARATSEAHYGWFWQLRNLPDAPESRYLYADAGRPRLPGGPQELPRSEVPRLAARMRWDDSMEAFGDMIDTRERAYAERLPQVDALLASGAVEQLQQRRDDLAAG